MSTLTKTQNMVRLDIHLLLVRRMVWISHYSNSYIHAVHLTPICGCIVLDWNIPAHMCDLLKIKAL